MSAPLPGLGSSTAKPRALPDRKPEIVYGPLPVCSPSSDDDDDDEHAADKKEEKSNESSSEDDDYLLSADDVDDGTAYDVQLVSNFYGVKPAQLVERRGGSLRSRTLTMPRLSVHEVSELESNRPCAYSGKVVMLGSSGVGKTQFMLAGTGGRRADVLTSVDQLPKAGTTCGVDFRVVIRLVRDRDLIKMMVWDTAGQERYHSLMPNYIKEADGVLLLYDITDRSSFDDLERYWIPMIDSNREANDELVVFLVGNKLDCVTQRSVSAADVTRLIQTHGLQNYFESTALRRSTVYEILDAMAVTVYHLRAQHDAPAPERDSLAIGAKGQRSQRACCK
jgi:small GTP-binding protein